MSTDIISGAGTDLLTIDPTSKAARVTSYTTAGVAFNPLSLTDLSGGTGKLQPYDLQMNQTGLITPLRHQTIGTVTRVFGDSFADGIGAGEEDIGAFPASASVTGGATGTAANGSFNMTTSATIPSTGSLISTAALSFLTGSVSHHQGAVNFPSANLTDYRVVSRRNSVDTVVESSAFNVVPTPITNPGTAGALAGALVDGLFHRLDIYYQGNAAIFSVDGNVVHRMSAQIAAPRTDTLDLNFTYEWFNQAGPIATLRVGQYTTTNGYFFECKYNVANVTFSARGASANRIGAVQRVYRQVSGYDANKTRVVIKFEAVAPATADTLLSLVKQTAGTDAGGATSIAVTSNKVLRITSGSFSVKAGAAAAAFGTLTLRQNPAGSTVIGSPSWGRFDVGNTEAVIGAARAYFFTFDDSQEFSGANTIGASLAAQATTNVISIALYGYEYNINNG
jgi:hypothetical protein